MAKVIGFTAVETIGIGIPNPRAVVRVPVPEGLTPEQLQRFEAIIAQWEEEAKIEAEIDRILCEERPSQADVFIYDEDTDAYLDFVVF